MDQFQQSMGGEFATLLDAREAALREILARESAQVAGDIAHEVSDFKDMAVEANSAAVDEVQADHASHELAEIAAARRRLAEGSYGLCTDCGDPIDLRRLRALPATACCTGCQQAHER